MKSKDFFRLLVNPFSRIAGWEASVIGVILVVLSAIIGRYSYVCFDGVLDIHIAQKLSMGGALGMQLISTFTLVLVMWIAGLITSKGFRFVDILGTMTFARIPLLIPALIGFFVKAPNIQDILANPLSILASSSFIIFALLAFIFIVWEVVLIVFGLKVSCNISGGKLAGSVIIGILASEIISKILIHFIL